MEKIMPCLWFNNNIDEAIAWYSQIFRQFSLIHVNHYGDAGPGKPGSIMTVTIELEGWRFMALNGGPEFAFNEAVSFIIRCQDQAEVDYYWDRLSEGGSQGPCGWLKDKFGLWWQIVPVQLNELLQNPDPEISQRAIRNMLQMGKIIIADL